MRHISSEERQASS